jgi:hypothetical protein
MLKQWIATVVLASAALAGRAQTSNGLVAAAAPPAGGFTANAGADFRAREENINNLPSFAGPGTHQDYFRFRTRVWGELGDGDVHLYSRLANEWRRYTVPNHRQNYAWPDEAVVDNLYLDVKGLFWDRVSLRVGRQDLMYGAGRVVLEGTPMDGSRTLFFDAVKATVQLTPATKLDLLGIFNSPKTDLAIHNSNHELTSLSAMTPNELTEAGAGMVLNTSSLPKIPTEFYYFWKRESDWLNAGVEQPGRDVHTLGFRSTPKIGSQIDGDFEAAVQFGRTENHKDIRAGMAFAGACWTLPVSTTWKPYIKPGCYYLSGDNNSADGTIHAWDPIWARYPQFSELYVLVYNGQYGIGYWSNLIYPHVETGVKIAPQHRVFVSTGALLAAAKDSADHPDERDRGWLTIFKYEFPLLSPCKDDGADLFRRRFGLSGHLLAEFFTPGSYYAHDSMAYFLRWEMAAKF